MHDNIEELIDLKKISNALQKHSNISFALIYGSSKDGKVNIGSDIDIAVWFDNNYNEDSVVNIIKTIESIYPDVECDLTILNSTTVFLQYEALKGKLLFIQKGKQNNWTDFYSLTCRKYEEFFVGCKINYNIENKLRLLESKISEISSWNIKSFKQLKESSLLQNATERALQVSVEIMIDVSERILAIEKMPPQNSSADNFKKLEELKIIKDADKYISMIKFRNFMVHRYEHIDLDIVYGILKNKLFLFEYFIDEIRSS